jgi:hypothetical protein
VAQGVERYGRGLIAYSLGDFLFDLPRDPADFTPQQRAFNAVHMLLKVDLDVAGVANYGVHWLGRDAAGRYVYPYEPEGLDLPYAFAALCEALQDGPELLCRAEAIYRKAFREILYDAPIHFVRHFRRGDSGRLRSFLWWLTTLRRACKRRVLAAGGASWLRYLVARLTHSLSSPEAL